MADSKSIFNLSYSQDNPNVNKLIEGTFGAITKGDIKVGYIDPDKGYVVNVSICEANDYAKKNPGTRFIFKDGNGKVKYININKVNQLTPDDIISKSKCPGIQTSYNCKQPPAIHILGGGGVGAVANAVIGADGSLMAIDVVKGGYGYQYPPQVKIIDECNIGAGAVGFASIGNTVDTVENYENELEDYEICEPTDVGYGKVYGPNGEDLGEWDPTLYTNTDPNSIVAEIQKYQEEVNKYKNPFWTTRKYKPSSIVSEDKKNYNQFYPVSFPAWNDFMNNYAASPVSPSNVPGSDNAGRMFIMQWDVEFPYDGEYIFRGLCDNIAKFYIDNVAIGDLKSFKDAVTPLQKTIKKGIHNIRIDLLNKPITETKVIQKKLPVPTQEPLKIKTSYTGVKNVPANFKAGIYKINANYRQDTGPSGLAIEVKNKSTGKVVFDSLQNIGNANTKLIPVTSGRYSIDKFTKNSAESQGFLQKSGVFPENIGDNSNTNIEWSNIYISDSGDYQVSVSVDDSVDVTISLVDALPTQTSPSTTPSTLQIKNSNIFNTVDYINKANRQLWRINPNASPGSGFLNQYGVLPFDPNSKEAKTESFVGTHTITWANINFPIDGNYTVHIAVDDNVTLYIGDTVIRQQGFYSGTSTGRPDLDQQYVFKKGTYTIRAELEQIAGSPLSKGNPMALAIDINTAYATQEVVSAKSWNENPMGVALTIDAPEPPVPQQKPPVQEGRCPPNPLWSTHFPGAAEKWYPVLYNKNNAWSKFMNQYALSPAKPLDTPGSDKSGVTYKNSWKVKIPYKGYYGVKGCADNTGSIFIDGNKISTLDKFNNNNPKLNKVYLTEGDHTIEVEVYNKPQGTNNVIDQKIFSTKDWLFKSNPPSIPDQKPFKVTASYSGVKNLTNTFKAGIYKISSTYHQETGPSGIAIEIKNKSTGNVVFDSLKNIGSSNVKLIPVTSGNYSLDKFTKNSTESQQFLQRSGVFPANVRDNSNTNIEWANICIDADGEYEISASVDDQITFEISIVGNLPTPPTIINQSPTAAGVVYEGPTPIASYSQPITGRSEFISPVFQDIFVKPNEEIQGKTWFFRWSNVDFPEDGEYSLTAEADDNLIVRVDGVEVGKAKVYGGRKTTVFNTTKGKRTVELELSNIRIENTGFQENPTVAFAEIYKKVTVVDYNQKSWLDNPMGVSAVLIPPPCPRKVSGKGVIKKIDIIEPGNGYFSSQPNNNDGYPAALQLTDIIVTNPGINYNCGVDKLKIVPDLGCKLNYTCDSFGRINKVTVDAGCYGFTEYPTIYMETETGVNFSAVPVFSVIRDPIGVPVERLIQVTDLVGLKQTGYVDGRAYYGAVYYENNLKYAGYYQTIGTPVRVYDTLQESITGQVTTPPSAIERFGTDVNSNNPNLNIPGTPQNTTGP